LSLNKIIGEQVETILPEFPSFKFAHNGRVDPTYRIISFSLSLSLTLYKGKGGNFEDGVKLGNCV
jgi:hypothetical protein